MTTRVVEWKKPYTWWTAITVDENKVISLNLRDENNLIIYDEGDDEIYVDLQLPDEISPTDAFPVWVTTGRVLIDNDWDVTWTILVAKTTSWDVIKLLYGDNQTLWIDNWTGLFKQIYFKADVDQIITTLTTYINTELAKEQNWVTSATAPTNPSQWDLWYDTVNDVLKVYDGSQWNTTWGWGSWDVQVSTDAGNLLTTGVKLWLGDKADFDNLGTLDSNTIYAPIEWLPPFTPWANTVAYFPFVDDQLDVTWNATISATGTKQTIGYRFDLTDSGTTTNLTTAYFINFWVKFGNRKYSWDGRYINQSVTLWDGEITYNYNYELGSSESEYHKTVSYQSWADSWGHSTAIPTTSWVWYNFAYGYDGTKVKIYLNWTKIEEITTSIYNSNNRKIWKYIDETLSNLIYETTPRTDQEVADYFNRSKGIYWIS